MKLVSYVLLLSMLFSCALRLHSDDIVFYDSLGDSYSLNNAALTIKGKFNLLKAPKIIVVATSDQNNLNFKKQLSVFSKVNAEEMQYLYVIANSKQEDRSGYYVEKPLSEAILSGNTFKISVYSGAGVILKESLSFLTEGELIAQLTKS